MMDKGESFLLNQEKERLKGAIEMAGSICHELNQPLQAIVGYAELIEMDAKSSQTDIGILNKLNSLIREIDRISLITKKLATIDKYKTKPYTGGQSIIDIDKSTKYNED